MINIKMISFAKREAAKIYVSLLPSRSLNHVGKVIRISLKPFHDFKFLIALNTFATFLPNNRGYA